MQPNQAVVTNTSEVDLKLVKYLASYSPQLRNEKKNVFFGVNTAACTKIYTPRFWYRE